MRTTKRILTLLCLTLLLTSCTYFEMRGNINGKMPLVGTMTDFPLAGKSLVQFHTLDNKLWCRGILRWTHTPNLSYSCDEKEGSITFDCNNDRIIVSNFTAAGCDQGYGHGWTDHGASFYMDYFLRPIRNCCVTCPRQPQSHH